MFFGPQPGYDGSMGRLLVPRRLSLVGVVVGGAYSCRGALPVVGVVLVVLVLVLDMSWLYASLEEVVVSVVVSWQVGERGGRRAGE